MDKVPHGDIDRIIRDIGSLKPRERDYVLGVLARLGRNGLSKRDIKVATRQLMRDGDAISRQEARAVRRALLEHLGDDDDEDDADEE